jgi:PadR family transcriptional regulator, regulatory protein PadR
MKFLSRIEEILLLAIWKLKDNAYGISIREQVEKDTNMNWLSGAIYAPLNRLKKNRFVETRQAEGSAELGGRPRIYYMLTPIGKEKLVSIQSLNVDMWSDVQNLRKGY